ncbi:hypothetical protein B0J18DRAFT_182849 [Chaetomium sp. MPI-SDFR-AT-0129]|nr:hypothetical protein B0J18DRAFT_182849 [Chaetomium sp. MPI-SDFR-AT-0129]
MLSSDPQLSSPPPMEVRTPSRSVPARALQTQAKGPDNGYVSPRQQLERQSYTAPSSPLRHSRTYTHSPSQSQSQAQPQHGLNGSRPPLSPLSEYHSGFADEDLGSPFGGVKTHQRQSSFPNLLPLSFKSRTPSPTRKPHSRSPSEQMPYTGEGRTTGTPRSGGGFVGWLSGSAGAANAVDMSQPQEPSKSVSTPGGTPTQQRESSSTPNTTAPNLETPKATTTTAASRFMSALSARFNTTPTGSPPTAKSTQQDELLTINLESALFPPTPSSPSGQRDSFSPAAFKNLQMNAMGLLVKLQNAYREQTTTLRDLQAERSAQKDELEEAITRAAHLKVQLEGMARRTQEQEEVMKGLMGELEYERNLRAKAEAAAAAGSIRIAPSEGEGGSVVSEDLGVDEERRRRRRIRTSQGKSSSGEDEECTTDDENESAESESVFSRCRSPALPLQSPLNTNAPASVLDTGSVRGVTEGSRTPQARNAGTGSASGTPKQKAGPPMSAFRRILGGISGEPAETSGCTNCKGKDASVAWDTVGLLRDENRHLKTRVGDLEVAVEGALDLVNGIGL